MRNYLFERQIRKSHAFDPVVINVGNLAVGGTGKTPMIEYLIRMLSDGFKIATLSRGYGRKTKGFRLAGEGDSAATLGDEPFQLYQAWKEKVVVAVGEKRADAIPRILSARPEVQVILLDDAYQHRAVQRDLNILLTTWERPFFKDYVLPSGCLREARMGAGRADMVVVTKCPAHTSMAMVQECQRQVARYTKRRIPVFFSTLIYDKPKPFNKVSNSLSEKVVLVSGLAKAQAFEDEAKKQFEVIRHFQFPDHYSYKLKDIQQIMNFVDGETGCAILSTEKDVVKWEDPAFKHLLSNVPVFTLPVQHSFIEGEEDFESLVLIAIAEAGLKQGFRKL